MSTTVTPDTELCVCGHQQRWHSHLGAGDCEHDATCQCDQFRPHDALKALSDAYDTLCRLGEHPRLRDNPRYHRVALGVCEARKDLLDALNGWPA